MFLVRFFFSHTTRCTFNPHITVKIELPIVACWHQFTIHGCQSVFSAHLHLQIYRLYMIIVVMILWVSLRVQWTWTPSPRCGHLYHFVSTQRSHPNQRWKCDIGIIAAGGRRASTQHTVGGVSPENYVLLSSLPPAWVGSLFFTVSHRFCSPISNQPPLLTRHSQQTGGDHRDAK